MKAYNKIILCAILLTSCSGNDGQSKENQANNYATDANQVAFVSNGLESTPDPPETDTNSNPTTEKVESSLQIEAESARPKTKKFYRELLDRFCKKFFDRKFSGMHYVPGSTEVIKVSSFDTNTVIVKGTLSFKSPIILRNNKEFEATIREDGNNNYHIELKRYGVRLGGVKSTGMLPFYFNPNE